MNKKKRRQISYLFILTLVKLAPVIGAFAGLMVGGIFVTLWGANPLDFLVELIRGAFGDPTKIGASLNRATPLMIAGVGTALAFKAGAFNVGQEGQLHLGALGSVLAAFLVGSIPGVIGLPLVYAGSILFGAVFAGIAVILNQKRGVHEVLGTLLLNFIGVYFTAFMVTDIVRDRSGMKIGHPQTPLMPQSLHLPFWKEFGYIHFGIVIGIIIALVISYILYKTPLGFRIRMVGLSPDAARAAGIKPEKIFALGMLVSGGLSGLAGGIEVTGIYHRLLFGFGEGLGFDSLAVCLLANSNPLAVIPSAIFFGALRAGSLSMQRGIGVPSSVLYVIRGSIILFVLIGFAIGRNKAVQKRLSDYEVEATHNPVGVETPAATT